MLSALPTYNFYIHYQFHHIQNNNDTHREQNIRHGHRKLAHQRKQLQQT